MTYHGNNTPPQAVGDLIVGAGANVSDRVAVGSDGQVLNADSSVSATGVAWANPSDWQFRGVNNQTDDYTLVLTDAGKLVTMNKGSANTLTVPPNADVAFPIGTKIGVAQLGAGKTTIAQGSGVTVSAEAGNKSLKAQYGGVELWKIATNTWLIVGERIA